MRTRASRILLAACVLLCLGLAACQKPHSVTLGWDAPHVPPGASVLGYNVYRSDTSAGPFVKLASRVPMKIAACAADIPISTSSPPSIKPAARANSPNKSKPRFPEKDSTSRKTCDFSGSLTKHRSPITDSESRPWPDSSIRSRRHFRSRLSSRSNKSARRRPCCRYMRSCCPGKS